MPEAMARTINRANSSSLGVTPSRDQVQAEIDVGVREFNDLDESREDSWIMTIEREDISEVLWGIIELCGYDADEEWLGERDW